MCHRGLTHSLQAAAPRPTAAQVSRQLVPPGVWGQGCCVPAAKAAPGGGSPWALAAGAGVPPQPGWAPTGKVLPTAAGDVSPPCKVGGAERVTREPQPAAPGHPRRSALFSPHPRRPLPGGTPRRAAPRIPGRGSWGGGRRARPSPARPGGGSRRSSAGGAAGAHPCPRCRPALPCPSGHPPSGAASPRPPRRAGRGAGGEGAAPFPSSFPPSLPPSARQRARAHAAQRQAPASAPAQAPLRASPCCPHRSAARRPLTPARPPGSPALPSRKLPVSLFTSSRRPARAARAPPVAGAGGGPGEAPAVRCGPPGWVLAGTRGSLRTGWSGAAGTSHAPHAPLLGHQQPLGPCGTW